MKLNSMPRSAVKMILEKALLLRELLLDAKPKLERVIFWKIEGGPFSVCSVWCWPIGNRFGNELNCLG